jgi:hypothetical protein
MDLWESRALPILKLVGELESKQRTLTIGQISDATGLPPDLVVPEVERLIDDGLIPGELKLLMSGGDPRPWRLTQPRLTGRGARAIEVWPRTDDVQAALQELLKRESDPEKRSKLQRLATALKDVGVQVVSEVLARAAQRAGGL